MNTNIVLASPRYFVEEYFADLLNAMNTVAVCSFLSFKSMPTEIWKAVSNYECFEFDDTRPNFDMDEAISQVADLAIRLVEKDGVEAKPNSCARSNPSLVILADWQCIGKGGCYAQYYNWLRQEHIFYDVWTGREPYPFSKRNFRLPYRLGIRLKNVLKQIHKDYLLDHFSLIQVNLFWAKDTGMTLSYHRKENDWFGISYSSMRDPKIRMSYVSTLMSKMLKANPERYAFINDDGKRCMRSITIPVAKEYLKKWYAREAARRARQTYPGAWDL